MLLSTTSILTTSSVLIFLLIKCSFSSNVNSHHVYHVDHDVPKSYSPYHPYPKVKFVKNGLKSRSNKHNKVTLYHADKTLAVVERNAKTKVMIKCILFDLEKHEDAIERSVIKYSQSVELCDFNVMMSIIKECSKLPIKGANSPSSGRTKRNKLVTAVTKIRPLDGEVITEVTLNTTEVQSLWRGIIPGTKWCGLGDEAKYYNDLGEKSNVDRCCRAHDHCPTRMRALELDYGIINFSLYTRSHCRCDEAFFSCLKETKSALGDLIGNFYFNIMGTRCIDEAHPCKSILDPLCRNGYIFKGRPKSMPRVIFVSNKFTY